MPSNIPAGRVASWLILMILFKCIDAHRGNLWVRTISAYAYLLGDIAYTVRTYMFTFFVQPLEPG